MTLQGRWVVEDTTTGQRQELSSQEINRLFERAPGRYRVVPSSDLKVAARRIGRRWWSYPGHESEGRSRSA